jgi:hypothetical protein
VVRSPDKTQDKSIPMLPHRSIEANSYARDERWKKSHSRANTNEAVSWEKVRCRNSTYTNRRFNRFDDTCDIRVYPAESPFTALQWAGTGVMMDGPTVILHSA